LFPIEIDVPIPLGKHIGYREVREASTIAWCTPNLQDDSSNETSTTNTTYLWTSTRQVGYYKSRVIEPGVFARMLDMPKDGILVHLWLGQAGLIFSTCHFLLMRTLRCICQCRHLQTLPLYWWVVIPRFRDHARPSRNKARLY
jgi:hypothetical protein